MIEADDSTTGQFDQQTGVAGESVGNRGAERGVGRLDGDEGGSVIAGPVRTELLPPAIEGRGGVSLPLTKLGNGEFGLIEPGESVTPLLAELGVGNSRHGFLLRVERNLPSYRSGQHGKIERLPNSNETRDRYIINPPLP